MTKRNDPDQRAVYAAEDQLSAWLDTVTPERATVTVDGATYSPETEPRFTDPEAVGRFVGQVLAHLRERERSYDGREHVDVRVRPRNGRLRATYEPDTCTMAVPPFAVGGGWALRGVVVLHEISHHLSGEAGHGREFRATYLRLLEDIGSPVTAELLQVAYAAEGLEQVGHALDDGMLARIAKLLRQAEGTRNEHERDAFLGKAQSLATRHSIALAVARAHTDRQERRDQPVSEHYRIGERGRRGLARYVRLLVNVAHANDLRCTINSDSTAVTMYGFAADIAVTKALYESLLVQMVSDCERYLASDARDQTLKWDRSQRAYVRRPVATITARLAFYEAFGIRIGERLQEARRTTLSAAGVDESDAGATLSGETALALRQKEVDVHDFFADALRRNGIRGTWSGDRRSSMDAAPSAADHGDRAARRASLGGDVALGAAG